MSMSILDNIKIKIKLKGVNENPLAIVTLTINDEVEVRFCPIFWKQSKTGIFFTMPSLSIYRRQNCFVVLDLDRYKELQNKVMQEFIEQAREYYHPNEFKLIESALNSEKEEEIDIDDIPL